MRGIGIATALRIDDGIRERRPRFERPVVELAIGEADERDVERRVDPQERAGAAEMTEGRRGVARPRPVRRLAIADLEPETPVERVERADARQDALQPWIHDVGCLRLQALTDQGRTDELSRQRDGIGQWSMEPLRRSFAKLRAGHPERSQHAIAERHREGTAIARLEHRSERVKPCVRVDPACPRLREDPVPVERQPRRVREQVPDGGGGRPGGIVEVDRPVIDRREDGECGRELGDGRPAEDAVRVAVVSDDTIAVHERNGRMIRAPSIDGREGRFELRHHSPAMLSDRHRIDAHHA